MSKMLELYKLAHQANELALRARSAEESYRYIYEETQQQIAHPVYKKFFEALHSRRMLIYGLLTVSYIQVLYWEWFISQSIYEVFFPGAPIIAFLSCVGVALYVSICLAEATARFSLLDPDENAIRDDDFIIRQALRILNGNIQRPKRLKVWYFSPITGAVLAIIFLAGIYFASRTRVLLLKAADESLKVSNLNLFLPVVLYSIVILLGIPSFFFIVWLFSEFRRRKLLRTLSRERMLLSNLRRDAIDRYMDYLRELKQLDISSDVTRKYKVFFIPPNEELRNLITDEYGYDPTLSFVNLEKEIGYPNHERSSELHKGTLELLISNNISLYDLSKLLSALNRLYMNLVGESLETEHIHMSSRDVSKGGIVKGETGLRK